MLDPVRICPACGEQSPLTAEHVWPQWLRAWPSFDTFVNDTAGSERIRFDRMEMRKATDGRFVVAQTGTQQAIALPHVTVKVCGSCNNGWMAGLESRTKPVLEALFSGERVLAREHAELVATWVVKTAFTYTLRLPHQCHAFDVATVQALACGLSPPPNCKIWVGHSNSPRAQIAMADTTELLTRGADLTAELLLGRANVVSTFIGANGVVFVMHYAAPGGPPVELFDRGEVFDGFALLWPSSGAVKVPDVGLSDAELLVAMNHLQAALNARAYPTVGHTAAEAGEQYSRMLERRRTPSRRLVGRLLVPPMRLLLRWVLGLSRWWEQRRMER